MLRCKCRMLPVASQASQKQQALEQLARVSSEFSKFCPRLEVCKPPVCAFKSVTGSLLLGTGGCERAAGFAVIP